MVSTLDSASKDHSSILCPATKGGISLKRWITLFVSFAVLVLALSLGVFADEPDLDIQDLYVYSNIVSSTTPDFATEIPQDGQISDRGITNNLNQRYCRIKNFSFTCPAGSWFLIDFDVIAEDNSNSGSTQFPAVHAQRDIYSYIRTDFSVSGSVSPPTIYQAEVRNYFQSGGNGNFVHYSIFGLNSAAFENNIVITFNNPITLTADLISPTANCFTQRITNVNCKISFAMEQLYDVLTSIYEVLDDTYSELVSIGDTLGNFYSEFHQYWGNIHTYLFQIFKSVGSGSNASTYSTMSLTYNNQGIGSWSTANQYFPNFLMVNMRNIMRYLQHHIDMENEAIQRGSNDAYDSLADAADFDSIVDFAGAGSAASWSSGSFSDGLSGIWDFFSNDTFYDLDTTDNRHNTETYIENFYSDNLSDYFDIVGSEYDGSASNTSN